MLKTIFWPRSTLPLHNDNYKNFTNTSIYILLISLNIIFYFHGEIGCDRHRIERLCTNKVNRYLADNSLNNSKKMFNNL